MTVIAGADPQALLLLGSKIRRTGDRISDIQLTASRLVTELAWAGPVGSQFVEQWRHGHAPGLVSAAEQLIAAAETITRNAVDQLAASDRTDLLDPGLDGPNGSGTRGLISPQLVLEAHQESLRVQRHDPEIDNWLSANRGLFRALDGVAAGADLTSSFLADAAQHPELPTDERIVHAISESALIYATEAGITQAMRWAGMAIAGLLTAGTGILIGRAAGWVAGQLLSVAFRAVDSRLQLTDRGADIAVEQYRELRDDPETYLSSVPALAPFLLAGRQAWQLAENLMPAEEPTRSTERSGPGATEGRSPESRFDTTVEPFLAGTPDTFDPSPRAYPADGYAPAHRPAHG